MPFNIMSSDPEVMALQAMLRGLKYIEARDLTPLDFKVLTTVELCIKGMKVNPNAEQIASYLGDIEGLDSVLLGLVTHRYLTEIVNKYGALNLRYKIGPRGGKALKAVLDRKPKSKAA